MSLSSIPRALRESIARRDQRRCCYCRLAQVGQGAVFHIDHIIPRSRGGATTLENLALQCPNCSLYKSHKTTAIDPVTQSEVPLYHPLQQRWEEHFQTEEDGSCIGKTPVGRATVEGLKMNQPLPRIARSCQIKLGLL